MDLDNTKNHRIEKIRSLLYREVSLYLHSVMQLSEVQIKRVLLSYDLSRAKFLFSTVYGDYKKSKEIEKNLNKNSERIRSALYRTLGLRKVPKFLFEYDFSYKDN